MRTIAAFALMLLLTPLAPAAGAPDDTGSRVFDVGAILAERTDPVFERLGLGDPPGLEFFESEESETVRALSASQLEEIVTTFLGPDAWVGDEAGVEWVDDTRLKVTASPAVLDAAAVLLEDLFLEVARRVRVRADLLTFDEAGAARLEATGALAALAGGRPDAKSCDAARAAAAAPGSTRVAGDVVVRPGALAPLGRTASRSCVTDFEVEIAQGSVVGDPIVTFVKEGFLLQVRPFLLADGSIFVETVSQTVALDGPIRELNPEAEPIGTMGMPAERLERFFTAGRVAPGGTLSTVRRGGEGPGALTVLLLTPDLVGPTPRDPAVRTVPTAFLTTPPLSVRAGWFRSVRGETMEEPAPFPATLTDAPAFLVRRLDAAFDRGDVDALTEEIVSAAVRGYDGVRVASADGAARLGKEISVAERPLARSFRVKLRIRSGDGDGHRVDLDFDVPAGRDAFYESGIVRACLADWDVEVAQESRVGDPNVGHAFGGLLVNLHLVPGPDGETAAGHVSVAFVDLDPEFETLRTGNEKTGVVEIPSARQALVSQDVVLAPGKPETIHEGDAPGLGRISISIEAEPR